MSMDLRYPNITGKTDAEQLGQVKSYLHQLVDQLNWALSTVGTAQGGNTSSPVVIKQVENTSPQEAEDTFNSIKALIIKSADIVKAYETTIFSDFNGKYFAESDFGTYIKETQRSIEENSENVTETYTNIQTITNKDGTGTLDVLNEDVRTTNAYIRRGHLYYDDNGNSVVGIEIGETIDGKFSGYARFTADKLSFFDQSGTEVAYIGAGCLYVEGKTVFRGEIQLGKYHTDTTDGLAFTWIEGG